MIMANGSYIINDIVSYTSYNQETGVKTTTYKNVNGNYSGNVRMMLNTPLKNKKFSINSMTMASFANSNGYINEEKNTNRNLILSERGGIDFRSSYLDLGVNGIFVTMPPATPCKRKITKTPSITEPAVTRQSICPSISR